MTQPANKRFLMEDRLPWPAEDLGTDSVTTDKILDGAVTSAKIANGTIVDADVNASAAIAKTKIAGTAVTLADTGTVTSTMIANGTIVEADLADGAVTSAKIADGTIVDADINTAAAIASTKVQGTIPTGGTPGQVLAKSTSSNFATTWVDGTALPASQVKQIVKNETGSTIPKGSVVYYSGANGTNILISLASASTEDTSSKTVGFTEAAINNGASGFVVSEGLIAGLNTSAATAGQSVWLGTTAGSFVYGAPPAKPAHSVYLGLVTKANPSTGEIFVKVQNGYELEELHNVNISTPVNGQALTYDSASQLWKNSTPVSSLAGLSDVAFTSPQTGEVVKYNGTTGKWVNGTAGGGINTTQPVPASNGDGWFYNQDGSLFIRYNDGDSSQWVQTRGTFADGQGSFTRMVASAAERDSMFPLPAQGNTVFRNDLGYVQTYYAAYNSSTNPGGKTPAGWYSGQDGGLVPIVPTSVSVNTGSASVAGNGVITLTNANGVSLLSSLPTGYKYFKVILRTSGGNNALYLRFVYGSTAITTGYYGSKHFSSYNQALAVAEQSNNSSEIILSAISADTIVEVTTSDTTTKHVSAKISSYHVATGAYTVGGYGVGGAAAQVDGMYLSVGASSISGTVQVFGYRN